MNQLESLVAASRSGVVLQGVKQSAIRTRGGLKAVAGPCDYMGCLLGGRAIVLDAKMGSEPHRLVLKEDHFSEGQRRQLLDFGQAGAIAGILALSTATDRLYWIPYSALDPRPASLQWSALPDIGPASKTVDWSEVERAHNWYLDAFLGGPDVRDLQALSGPASVVKLRRVKTRKGFDLALPGFGRKARAV